MKGFSLHICSGSSQIGDIKLDLSMIADIKGDMLHLPIKENSFDTIICDPPWNLPYHLRGKLLYQIRDILKIRGRLIFNAPFFPKVKGLDIKEYWICPQQMAYHNITLLVLAEKNQTQFSEGFTLP